MIILLPRNREQPIGFKERRPDPSGTPYPRTPPPPDKKEPTS
jgi:hypothetical protein